jgi:predicted metalloprotease with PDZ domain
MRRFRGLCHVLHPRVICSLVVAGSLAMPVVAGAKPKATTTARTPIVLEVDARQAPEHLFHARLVIPAKAGDLSLVYPKWIPGEHGPTGPINGMVGLRFTAGGQPIDWRRDDVDMYAFHCTVPRGVEAVEVALDFLSPSERERFTNGASTTEQLAVVSWNQLLLYPKGAKANEVEFRASLILPADWKFGTALPVDKDAATRVDFQPVTLESLVDSPVVAGRYFRIVPLTGGDPPDVEIDMACDGPAGLAMSPDLLGKYQQMVIEADALFGSRHFRRYHFLLVLSNHVSHFGLEHHESSDNRVPERALIDTDVRIRMASLLPHEYVHSWNGKYRRPTGLATTDYQQPMRGELLWVYEGLTQYLAFVLMGRSGLRSPEMLQDQLADVAAYLDQRPGRTWRPLRDTAVAAQLVFTAPPAGEEARRAADFYNEGLLLWLDADVLIRQKTQGVKSLDDFCKRFFAGDNSSPQVAPYEFEDLVTNLNAVAPHDWRGFLQERIDVTSSHAPLGGIVNGGWQLGFGDSIPKLQNHLEEASKSIDVRYSIGLRLTDEGTITDIVPGLAAAQAGVAATGKLVAVNGRKFGRKVLREAIRSTRDGGQLELLVQDGEFFSSHQLDYKEGERYPRLERQAFPEDILSAILSRQANGVATRGTGGSGH